VTIDGREVGRTLTSHVLPGQLGRPRIHTPGLAARASGTVPQSAYPGTATVVASVRALLAAAIIGSVLPAARVGVIQALRSE
jgi:hypothetical protein